MVSFQSGSRSLQKRHWRSSLRARQQQGQDESGPSVSTPMGRALARSRNSLVQRHASSPLPLQLLTSCRRSAAASAPGSLHGTPWGICTAAAAPCLALGRPSRSNNSPSPPLGQSLSPSAPTDREIGRDRQGGRGHGTATHWYLLRTVVDARLTAQLSQRNANAGHAQPLERNAGQCPSGNCRWPAGSGPTLATGWHGNKHRVMRSITDVNPKETSGVSTLFMHYIQPASALLGRS